ncbi:MAG: hypothetical protein KJ906_03080 [Nanoarchaeota archaeon]|nr:hypothetical protein [Nanoarchaeota archaeon]
MNKEEIRRKIESLSEEEFDRFMSIMFMKPDWKDLGRERMTDIIMSEAIDDSDDLSGIQIVTIEKALKEVKE